MQMQCSLDSWFYRCRSLPFIDSRAGKIYIYLGADIRWSGGELRHRCCDNAMNTTESAQSQEICMGRSAM